MDADEGKRLKVRVSFTDDAGNGERLTSAATDAVAAAPEDTGGSASGFTTGLTTVTVSVADAKVREAPGAKLEFEVTLYRAARDGHIHREPGRGNDPPNAVTGSQFRDTHVPRVRECSRPGASATLVRGL